MRWSATKYGEFLATLPDAALVIADGERILLANARADALLGYGPGTLQDQPLTRILNDGAPILPPSSTNLELALRCHDGQRLLVEARLCPLPVAGPSLVLALLHDISGPRRAQELLLGSEQRLRQAVRVSSIGIFDHDQVNDIIYWSPEQRAIYGWGAEEPVTLAKFLAQVHPADVERIGPAVRQAHDPAGPGLFDVEHRIIRRDGQVRWVLTRSQTYFGGEGDARHPVRTVGAVVDITTRLEAEERLRRSEARLSEAQRIAQIGSWELDLTTSALSWSDEIFRIFELDPARFGASYQTLLDAVHPEDRDAVNTAYNRSVADHTRYEITHRLLLPDGRIKYVHEEGRTDYDAAGRATRSVGTTQDVTEREQAEEALRIKEQAITTSMNGIAITDTTGRFMYANPAFVRMWGYASEQEVLGRPPTDFADEATTFRVIEQIRRDGQWQGEIVGRRKDGSTFDTLVTATGVTDRQGNLTHMMGSFLDITERTRLEAQLRQAQKMESIGRLAGGVAHDFNNLLTAINGYIELVLLDIGPGDPIRTTLEEVLKAGESAADLTQQLLAFSRKQVIDPRVLNLNEVIGRVQRMLQRLLGEEINLQAMPGDDLGQARVDPGQIEQILVNLAVNARDAMPGGGKLTLETANVSLDEGYHARHPHVRPGAYVMLAVSDEGSGMTEDVKAHLFEPFFTTKDMGKGTGLGLAMVYGAVKQNQGTIEVYTEIGQGTTFKIYFPRVDERPEELRVEIQRPLATGTESVILVEDEERVRAMAIRLLRRQGYQVHAFASGPEAIEAVRTMPQPLHLLITDVVLPGMNGRVLAQQIKALRPEIKVLFASGYTANVVVHHGVLDQGIEFIPKPYTIELLARRVREVLDRP